MKILQLLPELNEGGVERGTVEVNRELVRMGHESHVISKGGKLENIIAKDGGFHHQCDVCSKNILTVPGRASGLRELLESIDPHVIHARSRVPAWLSIIANRRLRIPFVTTVHGLNSVSPYSRVMTLGQRVICVSEVVRDYIIKNYRTDTNKIRVIQRGVDMNYFDPSAADGGRVGEMRESLKIGDRRVITSVGRITWLKDYETFIKGIAAIRRSMPDVVGVIVGGYREDKQDYFRSLQKLVADEGQQEGIVFAGSQSDMLSVYAMSDLIVNASLKMGNMGRTVVEALAMGRPVIATTFEGLKNLVEDGVNGRVIDNRDVRGLADAALHLLSESPASEDIRRTVPFEYTLECMISRILDVYREVTEG